MQRIDLASLNIIVNKIPPKLFDFDTVALDSEMFDQDVERLHRPHGRFASLQATWNGRDVYVITDINLLPAFFEAIDEAKPVWFNAAYDYTQLRDIVGYDEINDWNEPYSPFLRDRKDLVDCMILEQIMFGGYYSSFSLGACVRRWCGIYLEKGVRETFGKKKTKKKGVVEDNTQTEMTEEQIRYSAGDVVALLDLYEKQTAAISENDMALYTRIDLPCMWALLDMDGVYFDGMRWLEIAQEKAGRASPIWDEINATYAINGKPLNIRSNQQLKDFLRSEGIKVQSTTAKELKKFAGKHPVVDAVLAYKPDHKGSSTYGEKWLTYVEPDGRIHCSWNMNRAATNRFSADKPALQTIPVRKETVYRECFIAEPGNVLTDNDYSAQEPRIMAYLSQDEKLMGIFERGEDIYIGVGFEVFGERFDKKDPRRSQMKSLVLGLDYGMTPVGLLRKLREDDPGNELYTEEYAEFLVGTFFDKFPGVREYIQRQIKQAKTDGYVETIFGRHLHISPYGRLETQAPNFSIQGSAGEIGKLAVAKIRNKWKKLHGYNPIRLMVHDEILCECPKEDAQELQQVMIDCMLAAANSCHAGIPSAVDSHIAESWASAH